MSAAAKFVDCLAAEPQSRQVRIAFPLFWPSLGREASIEQAANMIAAFARQDHEVTVLMPQRAGDEDVTAADLAAWFDLTGNFRVVQRPSVWAGPRLHHTLLWLRQVFRDPVVRAADLLYSRIPAMFGIGGLSPIPFATDHYRPWPDDHPIIRSLVRRTARHRNCLGLIIHSHFAATAYHRAGVPEDKILVALNGYNSLAPWPDKPAARTQVGLPQDRPIALYAGRLDSTKGLDTVFALADRRPEVLFLLVGSEREGAIERKAAQKANVEVKPWTTPLLLPAWLAAADVLIIPPSREPLERFGNCVLPMKLFAYLAAARPILAPVALDTAELLVHGENAWLVEPDSPDAASQALDQLLGNSGLAARLSANAARLAQGLTWDRRAQAITQFLESRMP